MKPGDWVKVKETLNIYETVYNASHPGADAIPATVAAVQSRGIGQIIEVGEADWLHIKWLSGGRNWRYWSLENKLEVINDFDNKVAEILYDKS